MSSQINLENEEFAWFDGTYSHSSKEVIRFCGDRKTIKIGENFSISNENYSVIKNDDESHSVSFKIVENKW